ncbi:MAG: hypothetical protein ACI88G_000997, partial [Woeseiaceae bacterium]
CRLEARIPAGHSLMHRTDNPYPEHSAYIERPVSGDFVERVKESTNNNRGSGFSREWFYYQGFAAKAAPTRMGRSYAPAPT